MNERNYRTIYIYFDYKNAEVQTLDHVVRSLLKQLLCTTILIPRDVESVFHDCRRRSEEPELSTSIRLLRHTISTNFNSDVFIALDALDECGSIDPFIELICKLENSGAKIVCTSRPNLISLADRLNTTAVLPIEAQDEDIKNYVRTVLQEKWKYAEKLRNQIIDRLALKAEGK